MADALSDPPPYAHRARGRSSIASDSPEERQVRVSKCVGCQEFPCPDVKHECYIVPGLRLNPDDILMAMISESAPQDPADYDYAKGEALFEQTTVQTLRDARADVSCVEDMLDLGIYLTTAVKCGRRGYGLKAAAIRECSRILEQELALFPRLRVMMLKGDVAIKAMNYIANRAGEGRVIPAASTYRIRGQEYFFQGKRIFPSYLQAGPSFFIEKSKRRMIAPV